MHDFYLGLAFFLLMNIAVGLLRVLLGPTRTDRLLAVQLFGTTGAATLLMLSHATSDTAWLDVALVMVLLAAVSAVAFVAHRASGAESDNG